ncbi:NUDIX hydrolase [Oceanicola granulosus]|uniref:NUDIX hydrolase n=1 Tax=Oceanicola granulosus TaxID=252302 RepID=UPI001FDF006E|nr:NUDIX hydrolase [Oceanicola granulosus]
MPLQRPLRHTGAKKAEARTQFAVLPWRVVDGKVRICLVTSRGTRRWILPKGWPMDRTTPAEAAAIEAWEEAGLSGEVDHQPLGLYSYRKLIGEDAIPVIAVVYVMRVIDIADDYPESDQRKRKWLSRKKAADRLEDPELSHIVRHFVAPVG